MVEKPLASTIAQAKALIEAVNKHNVKLMVGHVERFNPAVVTAKKKIEMGELGRLILMEARRQGPFPARISDVGVTVDLAVHDIDIFRFISCQEVESVFAETARVLNGENEDLLAAVLKFTKGVVGVLNVNWLTPTKIREIYILGEKGMYYLNYLTQELVFYRNAYETSTDWESMKIFRGVSEGEMIRYPMKKYEPLRAELESFINVLEDKADVPVTVEDGAITIGIAQALLKSALHSSSIALKEVTEPW